VTDQPDTDQPATDQAENDQAENDQAENDQAENDQAETTVESAGTPEPVTEPVDATPAAATTQSAAPTATAVLTHVVRSIVDDAEAVRVDAVEGRNRLKLEVKVGPGDLGRVIGRRGRTAQSIRTVVRAAATRDGVEVDVDFVD
jgi:uncharacterized protein